ncbi:MAG: hypothetical protein ACR2PR_10655 [Pseudohongiellaceae bacterium]
MFCPKCNNELPDGFFATVKNNIANCPNCSVELTADMEKFNHASRLSLLIYFPIVFLVVISHSLLTGIGITIPYVEQIYGGELIVWFMLGLGLAFGGHKFMTTYLRSKQTVKIAEGELKSRHTGSASVGKPTIAMKLFKEVNILCPKCGRRLPMEEFYKTNTDDIVNCPHCGVKIRMNMAKFKRNTLFSTLFGMSVGIPALLICAGLVTEHGLLMEAIVLGSLTLGSSCLFTLSYVVYRAEYEIAE